MGNDNQEHNQPGPKGCPIIRLPYLCPAPPLPRGSEGCKDAQGWVATPGNAATGRMDAAAASIPLGRVAQPEEIASWVWLISQPDYGAFLTGETIVLSGGDVMR